MKNALIVANLGGFASFLLDDIDILQGMGYKVTFAANGDKLAWEDTKQALQERNVEFMQVEFDSQNPLAKRNISAFRQLAKHLKSVQYDLIHCHTPIAGLVTRFAAASCRKKGTKVLYTTHGFAFTDQSSWKQKALYRTMEDVGSFFCDGIITINQEDYRNAKKLHCRQVHYIHGMGVDVDKFSKAADSRAEYRALLGVEEQDVLVMSVGELSTRKNHKIIIEALAQIPEKERFVYAICGNGIDGGTGELLRSLAEEKKVRLKLLGFRRDIPQLMSCADIGAIPSIREGLGLAGIESLAVGVPVVGSAVQGIRDYIEDGKNGFLCDAYDAEGFARAILKLSALDQQQRLEMKKDCIRAAKRFDKKIAYQEKAAIYRQFLLPDSQ